MDKQERNVLDVSRGELDWSREVTELRMPGGRVVTVPTNLIQRDGAGSAASGREEPDEQVIPLVAEELEVSKKTVETGRVLLRREVLREQRVVDVPLHARTFDVQRVRKGEVIEGVPEVRREGDVTIYPVVEEEVEVRKKLVLREEIWVTERVSDGRHEETVELLREDMVVERS